MAKSFYDVTSQLLEVLPSELADQLCTSLSLWDSKAKQYNLAAWVNSNIKPDSKSEQSLKIYSILCDCSISEIKSRFQVAGY